MANRRGIKWNRDETILAYDLYCKIPFNKISSNNPDVVSLAVLLERTPGSVNRKLFNLAHFDPELQKRNVQGLSHASKLDEEISNEFQNDWLNLSYQAQCIRARMTDQDISKIVNLSEMEDIPPGEYRERKVKERVGQDFFRKAILNAYGNRCCVTGLNNTLLLIASHIKPWSVSDEHTERTNPSNGLCLNPFHDRAFDKGLITLDKEYTLRVSQKIKTADMDDNTRDWLLSYDYCKITLPDKFSPRKDFIEYHNDMVFLG